jgi:hypothetical protein
MFKRRKLYRVRIQSYPEIPQSGKVNLRVQIVYGQATEHRCELTVAYIYRPETR